MYQKIKKKWNFCNLLYVPGVVCPTRDFSLIGCPMGDWLIVVVALLPVSSLVTTIESYHATVQSQPTRLSLSQK